jgi:hypothetical protein
MLKSVKTSILSAVFVSLVGLTVNAQVSSTGIWYPNANQTTGGGRVTVVERSAFVNNLVNAGWDWDYISYFNPFNIGTSISDKAEGNVDARLMTPFKQRLNMYAITYRPFFTGFHRARVSGGSDGVWTYNGPTKFYTFTLTLYGDMGTNPPRQPYDFFEYPDVIIGPGEAAAQTGTVALLLPNGEVATGMLDASGQFTNWIPPATVPMEISGVNNSVATVTMRIENGDQIDWMAMGVSNIQLRTSAPVLRSRILAELDIKETVNSGPPTR